MPQERAYLIVQSILKDVLEAARILVHTIIRFRAKHIAQEALCEPMSSDDIATGVEAAGCQAVAVTLKLDKPFR